jgi:hypothetical protein
MLRTKLHTLRRFQVVALFAWGVLFLVGNIWLVLHSGRQRRLEALYRSARFGNLESIKQLAQEQSSDSRAWLEKLAQDRNTFTEYRVAAIKALNSQPTLDSDALAILLWIDQPFDVRHSVVDAFLQHGCDEFCISATLNSVYAMWQGQPTAERKLAEQSPAVTSADEKIDLELRNQTEKDYFALLNKNPCETKSVLANDYARAADAEFVSWIKGKLHGC